MTYDPSIFNINPYYDDFTTDSGFLRVLFRPGYALQAREITQAQSILQNQVSKLGDHLFKDGSRIIGGGISVRTTSAIRITVTSLNAAVLDYDTLIGSELVQSTTKAKIVHYVPLSAGGSTTHLVVIVDFTSGYSFTVGGIMLGTATLQVIGTTESCKLITVADGIFYVDGFFTPVGTQKFTPHRISGNTLDVAFGGTAASFNLLTTRVGFDVVRDTVTAEEDSTLKDPAIGSSNYNAPGGDRYKIDLMLTQSGITSEANDFIELIRFDAGKITRKSERVSYAEIESALSRRTFDESGSYIVRPFDVKVKNLSGSTLGFVIGPGKAYVQGHELESQYPITLNVAKARTTQTETNLTYGFGLGNYVGVCMGVSFGTTFATNLVNINSGSVEVKFRNSSSGVVATGYVHGAIPVSTGSTTGYNYNLYLYGLSGSVAGASTGALYFVDNNGTGWSAGHTCGTFVPSGTGTTFAQVQSPNSQSLVYEMTTGYAIDQVTAVAAPGRLWTSSTGTHTFSAGTTTFTITDSGANGNRFLDTVSDSYIDFDPNTTLADIAISNAAGQVFFPHYHTGTKNITALTSGISFSYDGSPSGFTGGALRVLVPVVYKPSTISSSSIRTKTSTAATDSAIASTSSTTENGRSVYTLSKADIYSITGITHSIAPTDISDYFELDDGQTDTHYNYSRIMVKSSKQTDWATYASSGTLTVGYKYFLHGGLSAAPFIGATSYIGVSYDNVPLFTSPKTGKTVSLANCLDFRHSGLTATAPLFKPFRTEKSTTVSYTHYLPRIDKVCLRTDPTDGTAEFSTVTGTPDISPSVPPDPIDAMVLGTASIPAYTHNAGDVLFTATDNKRYTMQDIGKIEKRIDDVEVFAKLSLSELETDSKSIKTLAGASTEPLKTSIFSEEFVGHSIGDVASGDHICSVDYETGELRPFFTPSTVSLSSYAYTGTTLSADGLITLSYTTTPYIENAESTKQIIVNPSNTINWLGFAKLTPSVATAYDVTYRPIVKTNALGENDNWLGSNANNSRGFGTQWNDWESMWTGIEDNNQEQDDVQKQNLKTPHVASSSVIPNINSGNASAGISRTIIGIDENLSTRMKMSRLKNRIKTRVGTRIVDRSIVQYIPATTGITFTVYGLKPSTTGLSIYFDGDVVKSGLSSDAYGTCGATFNIPANTYTSGEKIVRLVDSSTNENATTAAEATYYCVGALDQRDSGSYSTRPPVLRRQTVSSDGIVKNPFAREFSIDVLENSQWADPLSQTFYVDNKSNPEGLFIKSVELFFSEKDSVLPVTVQIRPTISGYPSPSVVLPFSTVTLLSASVTADSVTPYATTFTFSSPVFLEPGEYAICISTNSQKYSLYAADSGYNALASGDSTGGRVGNNQLVGTLYTSTSMGLSVAENSTDLMFNINRCVFDTSASSRFTANLTNNTTKQILKFSSPEVIPAGCGISRQFTGSTSLAFKNNENIYMTSTSLTAFNLQYTFNGTGFVSPVVDTQAMYATGIAMRVAIVSPSQYISRIVAVDAVNSNGLAVFVDTNTPSGSSLEVYYRVATAGEAQIQTKTWNQLTRSVSAPVSGSDLDYSTGTYGITLGTAFSAYQIKISLASTAAFATYYQTPAVRSIRVASFVS